VLASAVTRNVAIEFPSPSPAGLWRVRQENADSSLTIRVGTDDDVRAFEDAAITLATPSGQNERWLSEQLHTG